MGIKIFNNYIKNVFIVRKCYIFKSYLLYRVILFIVFFIFEEIILQIKIPNFFFKDFLPYGKIFSKVITSTIKINSFQKIKI